jgi:hypothetical protein
MEFTDVRCEPRVEGPIFVNLVAYDEPEVRGPPPIAVEDTTGEGLIGGEHDHMALVGSEYIEEILRSLSPMM